MLQKYSLIPVFLCLLTGLGWWSSRIHSQSISDRYRPQSHSEVSRDTERRADLLEALDGVVAYEHYYHSVYGHYTQLLSRIGFSLPKSLSDHYEIRIVEASKHHLLVTAFSEEQGKVVDQMSIDQDFQIHANFPVPFPRTEYLKSQAIKYMRLLRESPSGQSIAEQGVFKGFFEYTSLVSTTGEKTVLAKGVLAPVLNVNLELDPSGLRVTPDISSSSPSLTGQGVSQNTTSSDREEVLAQEIFHGETGRYAQSWSELEKIAHFRFDGKSQDSPTINRKISSTPPEMGLEIEPVDPNETE